jgi:hypothetical protein
MDKFQKSMLALGLTCLAFVLSLRIYMLCHGQNFQARDAAFMTSFLWVPAALARRAKRAPNTMAQQPH